MKVSEVLELLKHDGWYVARTRGSHRQFKHPAKTGYVPDLSGCVATGSTVAEVEQAIREAIVFHLEGLREDGSPIPPALSQVEYVEVAAA
jgi:predicted RNase H-like HicB family nuclease